MTLDDSRITIRGTSEGVAIALGAGGWAHLLSDLDARLGQRASFFKGGRVFLQVGDRLLNEPELEAVGKLIANHGMTLWAVESTAFDTQKAAQNLGLETQLAPAIAPAPSTVTSPSLPSTETIRRTLRSGQVIEHPGNIIIIGDVNPGAKVIAGGYIIVWGKLRGMAHAGAIENENSFICALKLAPTQLIIGSLIARTPPEDEAEQILPEMAFVQDGRIVAEAWR
jgi:septum site-determining protein MinC